MIKLRNVTSPAGLGRKPKAEAINLELEMGDLVSIVGLPGSGRRRLMAVLGLYTDDWDGEYELFGRKANKLDDQGRSRMRSDLIGTLIRSAPLVDCLSVQENLEIPLSYRHIQGAERTEMISDVLSRFGIDSIRSEGVDDLPADQRQLVALAKALVSSPRLLLLENPTEDLHPLQLRLVGRELDRIRESGCIVVQSVEKEESGFVPDRVIRVDVAAMGSSLRRPDGTSRLANRAAGI